MRRWWMWIVLLPAAAIAADPFLVGACTHFGQARGMLKANLSMMRQAGITSLRDDIGWRAIERRKGQYQMPVAWDELVDEGRNAGLEPLLILDYGNPLYDNGDKPRSAEGIEAFARYADFVATHFQGRVKLYEVWNEWDIAIGSKTPGTPDDYVALLKAVYPRIKAVDPSITVFGGAPTPEGIRNGWLERIMEKGALQFMDALSIHTYTYGETGRAREPEAWGEWMTQVEAQAQRYSGGKMVPLEITETGWPTQSDRRGTPPEVSAAYLARLFVLARTMPFLKGVWWYDFQDDGWNAAYNENNFGIVRPDLTPKPAWFALASVAALAARGEYLGRVNSGDAALWVLRFREPGGAETWVLWSAHPDDGWQVTLKAPRPDAPPLTVREVGRMAFQREWGSRDGAETRRGARVAPDQFDLVVRGMPWTITGGLEGATVTAVKRREAAEISRQAAGVAQR
jgi:polysaccharide biosynthesis protein PslG